jgi:hypothetical protein
MSWMNRKRGLGIGAAFLVAAILALYYWTFLLVRSTAGEHEVIFSMVRGVMRLDAVSHDLLCSPQARAVTQWRWSYGRLEGDLAGSAVAATNPFRNQLAREIGEMGPIFNDFLALPSDGSIPPASREEQRRFLVGQLRTRLATTVKVAESWYEESEERSQRVMMLAGAILLVVSLALVLGYPVFYRWFEHRTRQGE